MYIYAWNAFKATWFYLLCLRSIYQKQRKNWEMQTANTDYIYKNDLEKDCFQHDMAYGKFKDLTKRKQSDKVLRDKHFEISSNPKYDGYQRGLASMICMFLDKKSTGNVIKNEIKQNQQFANKLYKPIARKLKRRKVYSSFKDNIWGADLLICN